MSSFFWYFKGIIDFVCLLPYLLVLNKYSNLTPRPMQEAAFAQLKVWQSGAIAVIFFLSPSITLQAMLILMAAGLVISFGSFLFLTLVVEKSSPVIARSETVSWCPDQRQCGFVSITSGLSSAFVVSTIHRKCSIHQVRFVAPYYTIGFRQPLSEPEL